MRKRLVGPVFILAVAMMACSLSGVLPQPTPTFPPLPPTVIIPTQIPVQQTQPPVQATQPVLQQPQSTSGGSSVLPFQDDFSDINTGWEQATYQDGDVGYGNDYYFVKATTNAIDMYGESPLYNIRDVDIEVDGTQFAGPTDNNTGYGVMCRVQNDKSDDGYYFRISGDGYYSVVMHINNDFTSLLSGDLWQVAPAVNQGNGTNHLSLTCNGNHLTFTVNGTTLYDGTDNTFSTGGIGLLGIVFEDNATTEIHYTNFSATAP